MNENNETNTQNDADGNNNRRKGLKIGVFSGVGAAIVLGIAKGAEILNNSTGAMLNINELQRQAATSQTETTIVSEELRTDPPATETTAAPYTELTSAEAVLTVEATTETTVLTTVSDTETMQGMTSFVASAAAETSAVSVQTTAEPLQLDDTVKAESAFRVKEISKTSWKMSNVKDAPQFFDYDAKNGKLYYMSDSYRIMSYSPTDGTAETVADFSEKIDKNNYKLGGLAVNPFSGKLYTVIMMNMKPVLYNLTDDKTAVDDLSKWDYNSAAYRLYFGDADTVCVLDQKEQSHIAFSLSDGKKLRSFEWKEADGKPKQLSTADFRMPFLYHDCFYYVEKMQSFGTSGTGLLVAKTVRLEPTDCKKIDTLIDGIAEEEIYGISVDGSALCYFDKKTKNISMYNPDGERSSGGLLSDGKNQDVLLVDGGKIEETATGYLSNKVPIFLRIDNSHFVMFDASDSALKLLYTE